VHWTRNRWVSLAATTVAGFAAFASVCAAAGAASAQPVDVAMSLAQPVSHGWVGFQFIDVQSVAAALGVDLRHGTATARDARFDLALAEAGGAWSDPQEPSVWHWPDVLWQSTSYSSAGVAVEAVALRTAADLRPVQRKAASCHYKRSNVPGATVFIGTGLQVVNCLGRLGHAAPIQRVIAILPKQRVVLLGISPGRVRAAIRHAGDLHRNAVATDLVGQFAGAPAITLAAGDTYCRDVSNSFMGRFATTEIKRRALAANPAGRPYHGMGFATRYPGRKASASMVFDYPDAATASADIGFRAHAIQTETSLQSADAYASLLTTGPTTLAQNNGAISLTSPHGPLKLDRMWDTFDLAFARC
jgi:uncharacterized protein YfiM (DUF2279 family)